MRFFQQLSQQLKRLWLDMSVPGRVGFALLTAVCVGSIGGVAFWASQPDYRVLLANLSAEDAGAITAKLQAQGVAFRLTAGGTTVLVPAAQMQQLKVDMAVAGLPTGGAKGFELLDGAPFSMTPFMQHMNYGRAIQGELAKTIMQLEPVAFARVHVVRPDATPFIREQKPATASVLLKLKPGAALNRNLAAGIVALVAGSVEGLSPDGVTLLDTNCRVLSEPQSADSGALASTQLDYRRDLENYLAFKAEEMLAQSLGAGRAIVRITADVDMKRLKEKKENFDPDSRLATKEKITTKKTTTPTSSGGPAGTASNLRPNNAAGGPAATAGTQEEDSENEYIYSKTVQDLEQPAGNIERLTIAAMVDLSTPDDSSAAAPLNLKDAEEIIKRAVGFKPDRDEIKVSDVKLAGLGATAGADAEWLAMQRWDRYAAIARNSSLGVAALVALLLGRMILKRLGPLTPAGDATDDGQPNRAQIIQQLSSEARQNPEVVARILTAWLDESEKQPKAAA